MMNSHSFFLLLLLTLCFGFAHAPAAHAYLGNDPLALHTQERAMEYLNNIPIDPIASLDPSSYHAMLSTAIANLQRELGPELNERGFSEMILTTEDQRKARMFVKTEGKKRPFLVFVGGLSSGATAEYFKNFAFPLNKYYGYGVAIVENATSTDWTVRNQVLLSTGYEAGWDLYLKLKALKNHPSIAPYVSEFHVVGLSLGGSDSAFASYFDSILQTKIIDSVMNWSSPSDRYNAFRELRESSGVSRLVINQMFKRCYRDARSVYNRYTDKDYNWIFWDADFDDVLQEVYYPFAHEYFKKHPQHWQMMVPVRALDGSSELKFADYIKMFKLENFLPYITTPILWVNAKDDPIVSFDTSAALVDNYASDYFQMYKPEYGGHLGFPHSYGSVWTVETIVSYIQYWGKFRQDYYTQWKQPYQFKGPYSRYLRNVMPMPNVAQNKSVAGVPQLL